MSLHKEHLRSLAISIGQNCVECIDGSQYSFDTEKAMELIRVFLMEEYKEKLPAGTLAGLLS
jgi:hypothetical protein